MKNPLDELINKLACLTPVEQLAHLTNVKKPPSESKELVEAKFRLLDFKQQHVES